MVYGVRQVFFGLALDQPLELLAVTGAAQLLDVLGELTLGVLKLAALFLESGELGGAPFIERVVAGRARAPSASTTTRRR